MLLSRAVSAIVRLLLHEEFKWFVENMSIKASACFCYTEVFL